MSSNSVFNYYIIIHKCGFCKLEPLYVSPFRSNKHIVLDDNNIGGSLMLLYFNINFVLNSTTMHYLDKFLQSPNSKIEEPVSKIGVGVLSERTVDAEI